MALQRPARRPSLRDWAPAVVPPYLLEAKADVEDALSLEVLGDMGFRVVGCTVKLSARKPAIDTALRQSYSRGKLDAGQVRAATPSDLPRLQDLIAASHVHSHFFSGPFPGRDLGRILFRAWIADCLASAAYRVWVLEEQDGVAGFVSFLRSAALAEIVGGPVGIVDFLAVDPERQGRGLGQHLLVQALAELAKDCNLLELRTALQNLSAQRLYERFGFRMVGADYMLHNQCE